jgi:soluble lytic murein transglycosylase-like protein
VVAATLPAGFDFSTFKRAIIGQESGGRYGVANMEGSGAMGVGQVMPATAKSLAARIGLPYRADLMSGNSAEAQRYQDAITDAALKEAWQAGGGDIRRAAMYYHGGSDTSGWGPKTQRYAQNVIARMRK